MIEMENLLFFKENDTSMILPPVISNLIGIILLKHGWVLDDSRQTVTHMTFI